MTEGQFWRLGHAESAARFAEWVDGEMELEQVICPISEGHRRGGKRLTNLSVALRARELRISYGHGAAIALFKTTCWSCSERAGSPDLT